MVPQLSEYLVYKIQELFVVRTEFNQWRIKSQPANTVFLSPLLRKSNFLQCPSDKTQHCLLGTSAIGVQSCHQLT